MVAAGKSVSHTGESGKARARRLSVPYSTPRHFTSLAAPLCCTTSNPTSSPRAPLHIGFGYDTIKNADTIIIEQTPGFQPVCYRRRHGVPGLTLLATLPTSKLPEGAEGDSGLLRPFIFLRGFGKNNASVRVRTTTPPTWSLAHRHLYPREYREAARTLLLVLTKAFESNQAADVLVEFVLPFCGW